MALTAKDRRLYRLKAEIVAAAGHPIRLAVIDLLRGGEQCVCDIAEHLGAQRSNVSRHLAVLVNAGILEHRKEGLKMIYSLKTPCVLEFLSCVAGVLKEKLAETHEVLSRL